MLLQLQTVPREWLWCWPPVPLGNGVAGRLRRLKDGRCPYGRVSDARIGTPVRMTLKRWLAMRGLELAGPEALDRAITAHALVPDEDA